MIIKKRAFSKLFSESFKFLIKKMGEAVQEEINIRRTVWVREWLRRRDSLRATSLLFRELVSEDELEYKRCLKMTPERFEELLDMIKDKI